MNPALDKQRRIKALLALQRYIQAEEQFSSASQEFQTACDAVRETLPRPCRIVTQILEEHYLVTADERGNFELEEIEAV